jgi:hypothetical protein
MATVLVVITVIKKKAITIKASHAGSPPGIRFFVASIGFAVYFPSSHPSFFEGAAAYSSFIFLG